MADTQTIATAKAKAPKKAATFDFKNLNVQRLILHQIKDRDSKGDVPAPVLAKSVYELSPDSVVALRKRITTALGSKSHGLEVAIEQKGGGSFFHVASRLLGATESKFIDGSGNLAQALSTAQGSTNAPAGMIVVMTGTVGSANLRFSAVIKADLHDGFSADVSADNVGVTYLENLLLTPANKLFKIGLLVEVGSATNPPSVDASHYRLFLFDHLLSTTDATSAALYFYSAFLGAAINATAKKTTQDFFEFTQEFIESQALEDEDKWSLKEAVRVELKSSSKTINAPEFAEKHFPQDLAVAYVAFLKQKGFPPHSVAKDVEYVKAKLRARRIEFDNGVKITAPSDGAEDLIRIIAFDQGRTLVSVKGPVRNRV